METKTIINQSLHAFVVEIEEHINLGWEIDLNNPPVQWGFVYETGVIRKDNKSPIDNYVFTSADFPEEAQKRRNIRHKP
jgi:hypothetical protein